MLGAVTHREDSYMRGDSALSRKADPKAAPARPIVLSRWINEPYPPLTELLSAHDVARLTRRPRWLLMGLALIGRFPRKARFRGRSLGWSRSDVLEWMAKDMALERSEANSSQLCLQSQPRQTSLPLQSLSTPSVGSTRKCRHRMACATSCRATGRRDRNRESR